MEWIPGPPDEYKSLVLNGLFPPGLLGGLQSSPNRPELLWVSKAEPIPD